MINDPKSRWRKGLVELAASNVGILRNTTYSGIDIGECLLYNEHKHRMMHLRRVLRKFKNNKRTGLAAHRLAHGGYMSLDDSKSGEGREVPLHVWPPLLDLHTRLAAGKGPDELIFTRGKNSRPVLGFDTLWKNICRRAGVNDTLLVHDLRSTAAQRLTKAGVPLIKLGAGWKTDATFYRYAIIDRTT